jgi:acyl-CoA dehydrogenase
MRAVLDTNVLISSVIATGVPHETVVKGFSSEYHPYEVWLEDLEVPAEKLIGVEGEDFYQVMDGLNEERLVIAAKAVGLARVAIEGGTQYAREREVFERQIGKNQAI